MELIKGTMAIYMCRSPLARAHKNHIHTYNLNRKMKSTAHIWTNVSQIYIRVGHCMAVVRFLYNVKSFLQVCRSNAINILCFLNDCRTNACILQLIDRLPISILLRFIWSAYSTCSSSCFRRGVCASHTTALSVFCNL